VGLLNERNILNVASLPQVLKRAAVIKILQILSGSLCLQVDQLLIRDGLTWPLCGAEVVLGFALSLLRSVGASS
jgi:hypothetical protein